MPYLYMSLLAVLSALLQKWVNWNENSVSLFYYYQNNYYFWATYVGQLSFQQSWAHIVFFYVVASTGERVAVLGQSPGAGSVALLFTPQEGPFFRGSGNNSRSPDAVTQKNLCRTSSAFQCVLPQFLMHKSHPDSRHGQTLLHSPARCPRAGHHKTCA